MSRMSQSGLLIRPVVLELRQPIGAQIRPHFAGSFDATAREPYHLRSSNFVFWNPLIKCNRMTPVSALRVDYLPNGSIKHAQKQDQISHELSV